MPTIMIRNVSEKTVRRLKAAAKKNHRSLQAEVLDVLEWAAERYASEGSAVRAGVANSESRERQETLARIERELADLHQQVGELRRRVPPINVIGRAQ